MPITRTRTLYLAPDDDCHAALLATAAQAQVSLHLLIYGFTLTDLAEICRAKHTAGVQVGIVADRSQAAGHTERPLLQGLVDAGVPVTIATAPSGAINHEKVLLVDMALGADHDASWVVWGSYNFSSGAARQDNALIVENDPGICALFWRQYQETLAVGQAHPAWQLHTTCKEQHE